VVPLLSYDYLDFLLRALFFLFILFRVFCVLSGSARRGITTDYTEGTEQDEEEFPTVWCDPPKRVDGLEAVEKIVKALVNFRLRVTV